MARYLLDTNALSYLIDTASPGHAAVHARLAGLAASWETLPRVRDRNGPGSPWVSRRLPVGPAWSGRTLDVTIDSQAPAGLTVHTQAMLVSRWWRRSARRLGQFTKLR